MNEFPSDEAMARAAVFVLSQISDADIEKIAAETATILDARQHAETVDADTYWLRWVLFQCRAEGEHRLRRELGRPRPLWGAWRAEDDDSDPKVPPPDATWFIGDD